VIKVQSLDDRMPLKSLDSMDEMSYANIESIMPVIKPKVDPNEGLMIKIQKDDMTKKNKDINKPL
jgi:hypothetical protein